MLTEHLSLRIEHLQHYIPSGSGLLLLKPTDVAYFLGLQTLVPTEREVILLVTNSQVYAFCSPFTTVPKVAQPLITLYNGVAITQIVKHLTSIIEQESLTQLLLDHKTLYHDEFLYIEQHLPIKLVSFDSSLIQKLRAQKDSSEIANIHTASQLTCKILAEVQAQLEAGMTEQDVKNTILHLMIDHQVSEAFPTIVAFGAHTASPHHQPDTTVLRMNEPVLIDMGVKWDGYCSDMTRTWWYGDHPTTSFQKTQEQVLAAYQTAIQAIIDSGKKVAALTIQDTNLPSPLTHDKEAHPTLTYHKIDTHTRNYFKKHGVDTLFSHTTGHGIGLDIHEYPSVSWLLTDHLKTPVVITIEPGLYHHDDFGYRHEDTILVY